jgi:hypothetical protein
MCDNIFQYFQNDYSYKKIKYQFDIILLGIIIEL